MLKTQACAHHRRFCFLSIPSKTLLTVSYKLGFPHVYKTQACTHRSHCFHSVPSKTLLTGSYKLRVPSCLRHKNVLIRCSADLSVLSKTLLTVHLKRIGFPHTDTSVTVLKIRRFVLSVLSKTLLSVSYKPMLPPMINIQDRAHARALLTVSYKLGFPHA